MIAEQIASGWAISQDIPSETQTPEAEELQPTAEPWFELCNKPRLEETALIQKRFLCRGGGLLLVGQTGVGKSSFSRQMALHFALGKPFVGLQPVTPLRSLIIQAENDDQDEAEMCSGIVSGSKFTPEQVQSAGPFILHYREQTHSGWPFIDEIVKPLLEQVKPDLLWIDPLLAYLGGDQNSQEVVGAWLRNWLNPLLTQHNCGAVLVHHTPKLTQRKLTEGWATGDFGYLGAGSAEFANWSRAVLCLLPAGVQGVYELHAPKRGMRLGWKEGDSPTTKKFILHSRKFGEICWHESQGENISFAPPASGRPVPTIEEFLNIFARLDGVKTAREGLLKACEIRNLFSKRGWKRDSYAGLCEEALKQKVVGLIQGGRGNRTKLYGRPEVIQAYQTQTTRNGEPGDEKI